MQHPQKKINPAVFQLAPSLQKGSLTADIKASPEEGSKGGEKHLSATCHQRRLLLAGPGKAQLWFGAN